MLGPALCPGPPSGVSGEIDPIPVELFIGALELGMGLVQPAHEVLSHPGTEMKANVEDGPGPGRPASRLDLGHLLGSIGETRDDGGHQHTGRYPGLAEACDRLHPSRWMGGSRLGLTPDIRVESPDREAHRDGRTDQGQARRQRPRSPAVGDQYRHFGQVARRALARRRIAQARRSAHLDRALDGQGRRERCDAAARQGRAGDLSDRVRKRRRAAARARCRGIRRKLPARCA